MLLGTPRIEELSHELLRMTNESNGKPYIFHSEIAKQSMFNYLSIYRWVWESTKLKTVVGEDEKRSGQDAEKAKRLKEN